MGSNLVIGSRGSKLALWQADQTRMRLQALIPGVNISIEIIKTTGDVKRDPLSVIGGKGVFTKELEEALIDGRIDIAVHSLKDLPTVLPQSLVISAICEREDPRDALVLPHSVKINSLDELPQAAIVGTSSQRRIAQIKARRPDIVVNDLRGNIDTRIRKLDEGRYDALILASAGLRRLGQHDRIGLAIPVSEMLPAVGQGAIAIETRADNKEAVAAVAQLSHHDTNIACVAERALLRSLGGGCQFPIAAHGVVSGNELSLEALVASPDGSAMVRDRLAGPSDQPESLGEALAEKLLACGASSLLTASTNQLAE